MAWGFLSPQEVQKVASLAKQDIEMSAKSPQPLEDLTRLAAAGSCGVHPNKCFSDIMKKHGGDNQLPKAHLIKLPLKGHADDVLQSMILPHELFSAIYNFYPDTWSRSILPDNDMENLEQFWNTVDGHPSLTHHIRAKANYKTTLIPVALHGDGVPLTGRGKVWQQGFTNFSFYSLLGQGNTGLQVHRKIHLALKLNALFEGLLIDFKGFVALPPEAALKFEEAVSAFLLLVAELKTHFQDEDVPLFNTTEKNHFMQHSAKFAATVNPRMLWAFAGEDQQRRAQKLAETCMKGLGPSKASIKIAHRYRFALHLLFKSHKR
ncbi:hypothetical protein AK812_SmicGene30600 [Symbiodinium microadriaticum]|uniref:Uncharacterized protein n=1 Tax=Symbiodinium microadriaticum TaxID=2951 RepID=A0A1Q9CYY4_SYMMI|nr:hypothetical protein AK812_SmicGene30600 [Symbiodinium microadriaticum]